MPGPDRVALVGLLQDIMDQHFSVEEALFHVTGGATLEKALRGNGGPVAVGFGPEKYGVRMSGLIHATARVVNGLHDTPGSPDPAVRWQHELVEAGIAPETAHSIVEEHTGALVAAAQVYFASW